MVLLRNAGQSEEILPIEITTNNAVPAIMPVLVIVGIEKVT